ncbi:MAG: acylphosphatase [Verrucomicrobia bacterium]|nr:MAG: acylphosphatase [Verrucomicrobiota bacterium]
MDPADDVSFFRPMHKRAVVRYEGLVQGVGFRYTAVSLARRRDVDGYVRNEPDGTVTLVAQGPRQEIEALLQDIRRSHLGRYITGEHLRWEEPQDGLEGFVIRY